MGTLVVEIVPFFFLARGRTRGVVAGSARGHGRGPLAGPCSIGCRTDNRGSTRLCPAALVVIRHGLRAAVAGRRDRRRDENQRLRLLYRRQDGRERED